MCCLHLQGKGPVESGEFYTRLRGVNIEDHNLWKHHMVLEITDHFPETLYVFMFTVFSEDAM